MPSMSKMSAVGVVATVGAAVNTFVAPSATSRAAPALRGQGSAGPWGNCLGHEKLPPIGKLMAMFEYVLVGKMMITI